jgi:hypothetical protein
MRLPNARMDFLPISRKGIVLTPPTIGMVEAMSKGLTVHN